MMLKSSLAFMRGPGPTRSPKNSVNAATTRPVASASLSSSGTCSYNSNSGSVGQFEAALGGDEAADPGQDRGAGGLVVGPNVELEHRPIGDDVALRAGHEVADRDHRRVAGFDLPGDHSL